MSRITKPTKPLVFIGVDPGVTGGVAVICGASVSAVAMPAEKALWELYSRTITDPKQVVAAMEQVGGYVQRGNGPPCPQCGQSKNRQTGSAMFEFGMVYGTARMGLIASGLTLTRGDAGTGEFLLVPPQEWQKGLRIDPRRDGETDSEWKNRLKWNAEQHFPKKDNPNLRITLRTADALLIALYVRRLFTGTL